VGPRAVLDAVVKRKIPSPRRESNQLILRKSRAKNGHFREPFRLTGIYIHKPAIINKQFNYFSIVYFLRKPGKESVLRQGP
jgi:hypothetical protein